MPKDFFANMCVFGFQSCIHFLFSRTLFLFSFATFTAWVAVGGNLAYLVVSLKEKKTITILYVGVAVSMSVLRKTISF